MIDDDNPWSWMQPHDVAGFGEVNLDPDEQQRWCLAVTLGGLAHMWRKAADVVRDMAYDRLAAKSGNRNLIVGESVRSCGFENDLRITVGPEGSIDVVDIIEQARDAVMADVRGRRGTRGTWRYDYADRIADGHYDAVAVLQGVGHADDCRETAGDFLRVIKLGGNIVLAKISFSPRLDWIKELDLHVAYWLDKLVLGARGPVMADPGYYSTDDLATAFAGQVENAGSFSWRGVDRFWGAQPADPISPRI